MSILIVISDPGPIENESGKINSLFNSGLELFHLRKPEYSQSDFSGLIKQIESSERNRIVIHSHYELAFDYNLKGIHLTSHFLKINSKQIVQELIHRIRKYKMTVSTSVHNLQELEEIKNNFDYVFLSPVFNSISKKDYFAAFDLNNLQTYFKTFTSGCKVIALGGINANNIQSVSEIGFQGAALLGAIWKTENYITEFQKIQNFVETIRVK